MARESRERSRCEVRVFVAAHPWSPLREILNALDKYLNLERVKRLRRRPKICIITTKIDEKAVDELSRYFDSIDLILPKTFLYRGKKGGKVKYLEDSKKRLIDRLVDRFGSKRRARVRYTLSKFEDTLIIVADKVSLVTNLPVASRDQRTRVAYFIGVSAERANVASFMNLFNEMFRNAKRIKKIVR